MISISLWLLVLRPSKCYFKINLLLSRFTLGNSKIDLLIVFDLCLVNLGHLRVDNFLKVVGLKLYVNFSLLHFRLLRSLVVFQILLCFLDLVNFRVNLEDIIFSILRFRLLLWDRVKGFLNWLLHGLLSFHGIFLGFLNLAIINDLVKFLAMLDSTERSLNYRVGLRPKLYILDLDHWRFFVSWHGWLELLIDELLHLNIGGKVCRASKR